jgi:acetyl-CoA acyltransferase
MSREVLVAGVGMTRFTTPKNAVPYTEMGGAAVRAALRDAGIEYTDVGSAFAGYLYGDTCAGQRVLYEIGMTGCPIVNVNDACATGSIALSLARQAVASGAVDCALALGFEQMTPGAPGTVFPDRPTPWDRYTEIVDSRYGPSDAPMAIRLFGGAAREYLEKTGASPAIFGKIAEKARRHAAKNPNAVFRDPLSVEEVMASPCLYDPITRLQCCPPTCGAAAALVCSDDFARRKGVARRVRIAAQAVVTDTEATFGGSLMDLVGYRMAAIAAARAYEEAGIGPEDIDVVELHDCFASNEVASYEALQLTPEGTAERFIADGDNTYGGRCVVNPSGGLISKGHPIGATGLAQCAELVWQLRSEAGERQVEEARVALQHNLGLGGCCVVTIYR